MRKKLIYLLVALAGVWFGFTVVTQYNNIANKIEIYNDRLTEAEAVEFEQETAGMSMYYYNQLSEAEQEAYKIIYSMLCNFEESRYVNLKNEEIEDVYSAVLYDNSMIFWVKGGYKYIEYDDSTEILPNYILTEAQAEKHGEIINSKIEEYVATARSLETDFEKELYLHNVVCESIVYTDETTGEMGNNLVGAFVDGKAVCEGYARAMQVLLERSGIYNYLVLGDGKTEEGFELHMWNVVNINGNNYHLDATWNDTVLQDEIAYFYFNVDDAFISSDHINLEPANNNCDYTAANYFIQKGLYVEEFGDYDSLVTPVFNDLMNGDNTVEIVFSSESELNKALKYIDKNNNDFFDFVKDCVNKSEKALDTENISYYTYDEFNCLCLIFEEV